ncbi:MAG: L,D-transpeptidase family protein [Lachnospiraceae bacterium]|jgi:glucan-binding YG repeat protein/L,D-peptidoglycan transpeptidase YkuD (ErfK/YbiS/YcfS/YnhG family)
MKKVVMIVCMIISLSLTAVSIWAQPSGTGWQYENGSWYYLEESGVMVTGWLYERDNWYYLNGDGTMATGWLNKGENWYYLKEDGAMATGWLNEGGSWYYLKEDGVMATGWLNEGGNWYYLSGNGAMATGWLKVNGNWYYLSGNGAMVTGWLRENGIWYYLKENGAMATGWLNEGGSWYYLKGNGAMATGWLYESGSWYYLRENGAMVTGWFCENGVWYYLRENGAMAAGWLNEGGSWYYLEGNGAMATGWRKVNGNWYYLYGGGSMAQNTWVDNCYVNADGMWISPSVRVDQMQVSKETSQLIIVEGSGNSAVVSMHEKQADGSWKQILRENGRIGANGLGKQKEGDKKTPVGVYSLDDVFGIRPNPGTSLPYLQVQNGNYWVGDSSSPYYNSMVNIAQVGHVFDTGKSEHILSYGAVYHYCVAIGYNKGKTPHRGSAIFLHCSGRGATAGCVSIPEADMIRVIQNLQEGARIVIDRPENIMKY